MKIIYIHESIAYKGGLERIFVEKMNYLADKFQYEVYLLTTSQGDVPFSFPLSPQVRHIDLGVRFHSQYRYRYFKRLREAKRLDNLFRERAQAVIDDICPDFIICTTAWKPGVIGRLKGKAKKIMESHCAKEYMAIPDNFSRGCIRDWFDRYEAYKKCRAVQKYCDVLVTLTVSDARSWAKGFRRPIRVLPNFTWFVSLEGYLDYNATRAIAVGRLTYQKGFDQLIKAWAEVHKVYPKWKLDIFGEGVLKDELNAQIKTYGLEGTVTIRPFTDYIAEEYYKSAFFVLISNYEGFGLVLIEAMACGLPCVAYDCPHGPADIIYNEEDGILVEKGNLKDFTDSLIKMILRDEDRERMGHNAKIDMERYSPENIMAKWDTLFKKMI